MGNARFSDEFKSDAVGFMAKIDDIRTKVKTGQTAVAKGQCDKAIAQFNAVLNINAKIADAQSGLQRCRQAAIPGSIE